MKKSNQTWYIAAGILIVLFLAILLFRGVSDFRDKPKTESDFRVQKLNDLKAQYPTENNLTVDEKKEKLQELKEETGIANNMTIDQKREKLKALQDKN